MDMFDVTYDTRGYRNMTLRQIAFDGTLEVACPEWWKAIGGRKITPSEDEARYQAMLDSVTPEERKQIRGRRFMLAANPMY